MDIYFDILAATRRSVRKTHIMYKSNLSYKQLDMYLNTLIECNLIKEGNEDGARMYNVTSKGLDFIELFENLSGYLAPSKIDIPVDLKIPEQENLQIMEREPFVY